MLNYTYFLHGFIFLEYILIEAFISLSLTLQELPVCYPAYKSTPNNHAPLSGPNNIISSPIEETIKQKTSVFSYFGS